MLNVLNVCVGYPCAECIECVCRLSIVLNLLNVCVGYPCVECARDNGEYTHLDAELAEAEDERKAACTS